MTTPTLRDRSDAELRFATQSRQKHLQNLNYIQTGLKTIESRAQAAIASGNADELAKLKIKYQEFQNAQKEVEARLARRYRRRIKELILDLKQIQLQKMLNGQKFEQKVLEEKLNYLKINKTAWVQ